MHATLSDIKNTIPSESEEIAVVSENDFFAWSNRSSLNFSIENTYQKFLINNFYH